jgi:hypothetical protein
MYNTMKSSNKLSTGLLHFHVCVHCGSAFRREEFEGRSLTADIYLFPKCGLEGPTECGDTCIAYVLAPKYASVVLCFPRANFSDPL